MNLLSYYQFESIRERTAGAARGRRSGRIDTPLGWKINLRSDRIMDSMTGQPASAVAWKRELYAFGLSVWTLHRELVAVLIPCLLARLLWESWLFVFLRHNF
eukprot:scaffold132376_cov11-Tisochrysis_lutea.AAC.1